MPVTLFAAGPEHTFSAVLTATTKNGSPDTIIPHSNVSNFYFYTKLLVPSYALGLGGMLNRVMWMWGREN